MRSSLAAPICENGTKIFISKNQYISSKIEFAPLRVASRNFFKNGFCQVPKCVASNSTTPKSEEGRESQHLGSALFQVKEILGERINWTYNTNKSFC